MRVVKFTKVPKQELKVDIKAFPYTNDKYVCKKKIRKVLLDTKLTKWKFHPFKYFYNCLTNSEMRFCLLNIMRQIILRLIILKESYFLQCNIFL